MESHIDLQLTKHALQRRQQRGIDAAAIQLLLDYGAERRSRGASLYYLDGTARRRLVAALGATAANRLLPKMNLFVVASDSGDVITVSHRTRRVRSDAARRARRLH